jgi:AcrR family transcriptional regulator
MLVAESQRERLLRAMVREVAERGYDQVSVSRVVERAGVSRGAFYEEFAGKDECLFEAYDAMLDVLISRVRTAFTEADPWPTKVRLALGVLLEELAADPGLARMATVEIPSAGPTAHQRYREGIQRFLPFFRQGRDYSGRDEELPKDAELMAVGGAEAIIFDEVVAGRVTRLPALLPDILFTLLVPYLGPEEAVAEMRRAQDESSADGGPNGHRT